MSSRGQTLQPSDQIIWAEVVVHDHKSTHFDEANKRKNGKLAVTLLDLSNLGQETTSKHVDPDFKKGDQIAIIDCRTFVPEHIPVLRALEAQRHRNMPFEGGYLLNIGKRAEVAVAQREAPEQSSSSSEDLAEHLDEDDIRRLITDLVNETNLDPIMQLRRHKQAKRILIQKLAHLVKAATLDEGQLQSFLQSLTNSVHCTQGPPGTGKVCVGVFAC